MNADIAPASTMYRHWLDANPNAQRLPAVRSLSYLLFRHYPSNSRDPLLYDVLRGVFAANGHDAPAGVEQAAEKSDAFALEVASFDSFMTTAELFAYVHMSIATSLRVKSNVMEEMSRVAPNRSIYSVFESLDQATSSPHAADTRRLITQNLAAESLQELLQLRLGEYLHRQLTPAWDASTQRWKQSWLQGDLAHVDRRSDTDESQVGDVVAALPYKVAMAFTNALHEGGTSRRRSRWPRALNSRLENAEWQLVASLSDFVPAFREAEREAWEYEGRIFDSAFAHGVLSGALRAKRLPIGLHDAVIAPGTVEFTVFVRPQRKTNLEAIRSAGQTLRFSAEVLSPSENGKPIVALTTTDGAPHGLSLLTGTAWRQNADVVGVAMHGKYADIADVFASRQGAVWLTDRSLPELRELEFRAPDFRAGPAIAL